MRFYMLLIQPLYNMEWTKIGSIEPVACCHSSEMLGIKMLSFERKLQEQTWSMYYSFKDSLKIQNWCNNQMNIITQRNQQASPEGPANHVYGILSEIKDIMNWTETVIKLNFCQKMEGGGKNINILCN